MKHKNTPAVRNLLSRPDPQCIADMGKALAQAAGALPLSASHAKDLPFAVRDLSRILTAERGDLARSYWAAPRFVSAYLRYFLPWNLFRLSWLLPNLPLPLKPGASILDLGSGPLTLPLALWCARPELRALPLRFVCTDVAAKAMEHGRAVLSALSGPDAPWTVELARAPLERALRQARGKDYALVMAGNVLNEVCSGHPDAESHLAGRLEDLAALGADALAPGGAFLLLEPGTRLGGKLVALFRKGALRHGFAPLAPCTHDGPCPMEAASAGARNAYSGWCHFIHPVDGAPAPLADLTQRAHLEKDSLALSCLLLERREREDKEGGGDFAQPLAAAAEREADGLDALEALYREIMEDDMAPPQAAPPPAPKDGPLAGDCPLRVISGPIRLPEQEEPARYACCEEGLALLENARRIPSGAGVVVHLPERPRRDAKTGALLLRFEADKQSTGKHPADKQSTGKHPADKHSADKQWGNRKEKDRNPPAAEKARGGRAGEQKRRAVVRGGKKPGLKAARAAAPKRKKTDGE